MSEKAVTCGVCGEAVNLPSALFCGRCRAPYHVDCWHFVGTCSVFGCGGAAAVRQGELVAQAPAGAPMVIDEHSRLPLRALLLPLALGWVRKMARRARDMPRTLAAGAGGAGVAVVGMLAFEASFKHLYFSGLGTQKVLAVVIGFAYGLMAPFLAPTQLERPLRTAALALLAYYLLFFKAPVTTFFFGLAIGALILSSTALSEAVMGAGSRLGRRLGRLGIPLRMGLAWGFMALVLVLTHPQVWFGGRPLIGAQYLEMGLWALLAVFSAGTALETGKEELKKKMLAAQTH